jgi:tRNA-splicing ligase RtcB (3'-phosphate/5'-hydroxy nucleic acid ligase)
MSSLINGDRVPVRVWAPVQELDSDVIRQLKALASLPWVAHHVAVMPDVHLGKGATVGSVVALRGAVSPAAVGVDIGCGMAAVKTSLVGSDLPDDLSRLRASIERAVPLGRDYHRTPAWKAQFELRARSSALFDRFAELDPSAQRLAERASLQLGTLGGGNHFIELCLDGEQNGFASAVRRHA